MTQQPYGQPYGYGPPQPPQYASPQYQQPQQQYAPPQQQPGPAPMQLSTLAGEQVVQAAPPAMPNFTDLLGRLLYVLPKRVESHQQYGDKIIADVVFFDGEPITHTTRDKSVVPLKTPARPGELLEDLWITSSRIVSGLKGTIGRTQGFAVRLDKEGNAFVLRDATPAEAQMVATEAARIRAGHAAGAHAGNPLAQHAAPPPQSPAAAVAQASGYGQQAPQGFPPGPNPQPNDPWAPQYQQQPQGAAWPQQGQQVTVAGQAFTATGQGPLPGQQGMPPEQPQQATPPGQFDPGAWMGGQQ